MRRCYRCGAKMLTDAIVCEKCEQELQDRFSLKKIRAEIVKRFEGVYLAEHMDEWTRGEHYAYLKVLEIIDKYMKGEENNG